MRYTKKTAHSVWQPGGGPNQKPSCDGFQRSFYHRAHPSAETIFCEDGRRRVPVGTYRCGSGVFLKSLRDEHILRKPEGIAVQESVLQDLRARGCKLVRAKLLDQGRTLEAPLSAFTIRGVVFDRGYGSQRVLPLHFWRDLSAPQLDLFKEDWP